MNSVDREMLLLVAKAVGFKLFEHRGDFYTHYVDDRDACKDWSPLKYNEDALWLATECQLNVFHIGGRVYAMESEADLEYEYSEYYRDHADKHEATRRVIVQAVYETEKLKQGSEDE